MTSPNHPGTYPDNLEKTETIQVEQGLTISLEFTAFDIQYAEYCGDCSCDHLTITDGDGTTLMEKSCGGSTFDNVVIGGQIIGSSLPPTITSRTNIVNLMFSTDDYGTRTGWSVSWSAVSPGECQQHVWIFLDNLSNFLFFT